MAVRASEPGFARVLGELLGGVRGTGLSVCVVGEADHAWVLRADDCPVDEAQRPTGEIELAGHACARLPDSVSTASGPREVWIVAPEPATGAAELVEPLCEAASRIEELQERGAPRRSRKQLERMTAELTVGARIQQRLLVSEPPITCPSLEIAPLSVPSRQVDGDFFEFMHYGDDLVDVLLGDVMGKGLPAALVGAALKNEFFRALALEATAGPTGVPPSPESVLGRMHLQLAPELVELGSFVTACYARLEPALGELAVVDCGHAPPLLYESEGGEARFLRSDPPGRVNLPLGVDPACTFRAERYRLAPGDVLVLYSDGVTEARDPGGEMFGAERLRGLVEETHDLAAGEIARAVQAAVARFTGSTRFRDDLTCVVVRAVTPDDAPRLARVLELRAEPGRLGEVRAFAAEVLEAVPDLRGDAEERGRVALALVEAAQNVVEHGYPDGSRGGPRRTLRIEARADAGEVCFTLVDDGRSFDPGAVAEPVFDGSRSRGFGLHIIREVMDEVDYVPGEEGPNRLRLVLRRAPRRER